MFFTVWKALYMYIMDKTVAISTKDGMTDVCKLAVIRVKDMNAFIKVRILPLCNDTTTKTSYVWQLWNICGRLNIDRWMKNKVLLDWDTVDFKMAFDDLVKTKKNFDYDLKD